MRQDGRQHPATFVRCVTTWEMPGRSELWRSDQEITTSARSRDRSYGHDEMTRDKGCPGPAVTAMRLSLAPGSGSVLPEGDDDVVAEGFELALGVAGLAAAVGVPGVSVGAEVAVAGGGVVQQVPDADEDGPADGAAGLLPPAAAGAGGQAAEPLAQEGV